MKTKNSVSYSLIGGIIFSVLTLFQLITLIRFFSFAAVLLLAGYAVTATALFMEKRDFLPIVGIGLLAFSKLISFFQGFSTVTYRVRTYSYFSGVFEHFNLFTILPALVTLTAYGFLLFLAVCTFTDCLPKQKTFVKNIWFLPAALTAVSFAGGLLIYALIGVFSGGIWMGGIAYHSFFNILQTLLLTAGLLMTGMWLAYPQAEQSPFSYDTSSDTSGSFTGFAHASKETTAQAQTASGSPDFRQTPDSATDSQPTPQKESADSPAPKSSLDIAEELKIYKELLDSEIITQEEFDAKKKQLLNL